MSRPHKILARDMAGSRSTAVAASDRAAWIHVAFGCAAVVVAILFFSSYRVLVTTWATSGMFQFQLLVPPIVAILIWGRADRLNRLSAQPDYRGLAIVAAVGFVWLLGRLADVDLVTDITVIAVIPALVYSFYGVRITRALTFPLAYLVFAVPVGHFLVGNLQQVTAHASVALLHLTGVPVTLHGNMIDTPAAIWHVAEACSGIKFLLATAAFGVLYAHLFFNRWRRRLVFVACSLIVPVIANALRVYFTILIGETFGVQYASGTDHMIFGWQFFGAVLVALFLAGWPWHEPSVEAPIEPGGGNAVDQARAPARVGAFLAVALLAIAFAPAWSALSTARAQAAGVGQWTLPPTLAGLNRMAGNGLSATGQRFVAPSVHASAVYGRALPQLRLDYVAYGGRRELLAWKNRLFNAKRWQVVDRTRLAATDGRPALNALELKSKNSARRLRLRYVYRVGNRWLISPAAVKAWRVAYGLAFVPAPTSVLIVTADAGRYGVERERVDAAAGRVVHAVGANNTHADP